MGVGFRLQGLGFRALTGLKWALRLIVDRPSWLFTRNWESWVFRAKGSGLRVLDAGFLVPTGPLDFRASSQ